MTWPLVAVVLLLGACGEAADTPVAETTAAPGASADPTGVEPTTPPPHTEDATDAPAGQAAEVEAAIADLAGHLGISPAEVRVVSHEDVTWPDGAIGCPQPGMSYTQAEVPGTRLILEAGGVEYSYHGGREPELFRCDSLRPSGGRG